VFFAIPNVYTKNITKNKRRTRLSPLVRILISAPEKNTSKLKNRRAREARIVKGISLKIVEDFAVRGYTIAAAPSISKVLAILEPITFQRASPVCPFIAENIFTKSSGALVPKATIVSPITRDDIPNLFAILDAPLTKKSAPLIKTINQTIRRI